MPDPKAIILRTAGTNCDSEMVLAFQRAGARPDLVHLDRVITDPAQLEQYDLFGFPGGFSYGDDVASGRVFALRLREFLYPALRDAAERGACMIGACNGFQVLVQVGLLPGPEGGAWPREPGPATVALAHNAGGRFIDMWIPVRPEPGSRCVWTRDLPRDDDLMRLPIAHGEGRFVTANDAVMRGLAQRGQIAMRYGDNINGSQGAVAGICDSSGRIFGLMPHPERYLDPSLHPFATRLGPAGADAETPGLRIFRNAVNAVRDNALVSR